MAIRIAIEVDQKQAQALDVRLAKFPIRLKREVAIILDRGLNDALQWMISHRLSGSPSRPGFKKPDAEPLGQLSGSLAHSWKVRVQSKQDEVVGEIRQDQRFKARVYARIHEFGGTIRAKNVQFLTIPLTMEARQRRARQIAGLFTIRSRAGNLLLVRRRAASIEPLYSLKREVRMPARPFLRPTAEMFFPRIARQLVTALNRAL
jgi:phage gpG-like protein